MIRIIVSGGVNANRGFTDDRKAEQFIKQLYTERRLHPWYMHKKAIERLEERIGFYRGASRSKQKMKLVEELERLKNDRQEVLDLLGYTSEPLPIVLQITTE